jgi:hypothetical protein
MPGRAVGRPASDLPVSTLLPLSVAAPCHSGEAHSHTGHPHRGHPTGAVSNRSGVGNRCYAPVRTIASRYVNLLVDEKICETVVTTSVAAAMLPIPAIAAATVGNELAVDQIAGPGRPMRSGENYTGTKMDALYFTPSRLHAGVFYDKSFCEIIDRRSTAW